MGFQTLASWEYKLHHDLKRDNNGNKIKLADPIAKKRKTTAQPLISLKCLMT